MIEVCRVDDLLAVLQSSDRYSARSPEARLDRELSLRGPRWVADLPNSLDGAEHARYRKILQPLFTPQAAVELEPELRERCARIMDSANTIDDVAYTFAREAIEVILRRLKPALTELGLTYEELRGLRANIVNAARATLPPTIAAALTELEPDLRNELAGNKTKVRRFVEEIIRLNPPVEIIPRWLLPTNEFVRLHIDVINRVEYGDQLGLDGKPRRHYSFGAGAHRCLGSNFARMILVVLVEEWVK